ncbi:hypothetical protein Tco_1201501 [Tanacetum coccineum]
MRWMVGWLVWLAMVDYHSYCWAFKHGGMVGGLSHARWSKPSGLRFDNILDCLACGLLVMIGCRGFVVMEYWKTKCQSYVDISCEGYLEVATEINCMDNAYYT